MLYTSFPYTIGLTGTIASGKSTAASFFKQQGIDVINADVIARELTALNTPALETITSHFGQGMLKKNGELDRRALRNKIMLHPDDKCWLEAYLHPQIRLSIEAALQTVTSPYAVVEIPLLIRREDFPYLNHVLLLEISQTLQIQRLMARDQCSEEDAEHMINMQPNQTIRRALADDIVQNDADPVQFEHILDALHTRYLNQAQVTASSGIKN